MKTINAAIAVLTLSLMGCRPPDPKEVAARTSKDVQSLIREAWETGAQTNNWRTVDDAFVQMGASSSSASRPKIPEASNLDSSVDAVSKITERVFTQANVEDTSGGAITFSVRGVDVCADDKGVVNADCSVQIDKLHLRLKASGDLDVAVLLGPDRIEVMTISIRSGQSIAVQTDLGNAQKAAKFITDTFNTQMTSNPFMTVTATGRIEIKLQKNGPQDFTISESMLTPMTFSSTGQDGVIRSSTAEARSPSYSLRVEAGARKATAKIDMGKTTYKGLWSDLGNPMAHGPLEAILSGVSATVIVEDGKSFRVDNLGFGGGQSVVRYSGTDIITFDFNKALGRSVNVTADLTGRGATASFNAGLSADVFTGFGAFDVELGTSSYSQEFKNAHYSGSFTAPFGTSPAIEFIASHDMKSAGLQLKTGELKLSVDDPQVAPRVFSAPMCLGGTTSTVTLRNSIVEGLSAIACP